MPSRERRTTNRQSLGVGHRRHPARPPTKPDIKHNELLSSVFRARRKKRRKKKRSRTAKRQATQPTAAEPSCGARHAPTLRSQVVAMTDTSQTIQELQELRTRTTRGRVMGIRLMVVSRIRMLDVIEEQLQILEDSTSTPSDKERAELIAKLLMRIVGS